MTTARVRSVDIRPGSSAAANQRAVCLSSLREHPGRSLSGAVSLSATRCTRVSIRMSLTMFPPKAVAEASGNPPTEVNTASRKASAPTQAGLPQLPCLLNTGNYIYPVVLNDTVPASQVSGSGGGGKLSEAWPTCEYH